MLTPQQEMKTGVNEPDTLLLPINAKLNHAMLIIILTTGTSGNYNHQDKLGS